MTPTDPTYRTVASAVEAELEVKRSRFRCLLSPVADEVAARAVIEQRRREFWDARHHCTAFVLGEGGEVERSSDDGEPAGTAGAPMLEALRGAEATYVLAVVTRWFGGTLLGTGGLVRAYGDAVREGLAAARWRTMQLVQELVVTIEPAVAGRVEAELRQRGVAVLDTRWGVGQVELELGVVPSERPRMVEEVAAMTAGAADVRVSGERWVASSG